MFYVFGGSNGAITLSVTGGTTVYTYNWGGGITTQNRTALTAGTYNVTITDANACTTSTSATITQPAAALSASTSTTNVLCFGGNNGAITLSVTGGTTAYSFNWGGGVTTQNRTALSSGVYNVTVTDANACTTSTSATITQPAAALSASTSTTNVLCFGGNNGAITLTVTGGTTAYTYNWGGGVTTQNRTALTSGTYNVTVTDANACTTTTSATITQPAAALSASTSTTNVLCFGGNNGAITLTVTGGTTAYSFNWGGGVTTQNRNALTAGTYNVTITDANACSTTTSATITQPAAALSASTSTTNVLCFGGNNGAITLTVTGGTTAYSFNWGGGVTTQNRNALTAGTYNVTITDANACSTTTSATITQPAAALSASTSTTNVLCFGGSNGAITLSVTGGTTAYSFNWGGGVTTQNRTALTSGTYNVTVTDANTCTTTTSETITQPAAALSASTATTNVLCFGGSNGAITLSVTGGTTVYTYNWGGGITTQNRTTLTAGTYTATVTDANACTTTVSATITQPSIVSITETHVSANCNGAVNGSIDITTTGGTSPYTYNWGGGITTEDRTNLAAGTYSVTANDINNCSSTLSVNISQPTSLAVTNTIVNVACNGGSTGSVTVNVTGGTGAYAFNWGGGIITQSRINLAAGSYTVTVNDANSCSAVSTATVTEPALLQASGVTVQVTCPGGNNGSIFLNVTGGNIPYIFNWNAGVNQQNILGLVAGSYTVTVVDHKQLFGKSYHQYCGARTDCNYTNHNKCFVQQRKHRCN